MKQVAQDDLSAIIAKEAWTAADAHQLLSSLGKGSDSARKLRAALSQMDAANAQPNGAVALKVGMARYILCRFAGALDALAEATDNQDRHYFQGMCYKALRQYDKAVEEFGRAKAKGWDGKEIELELIELDALAGRLDAAEKSLGKLADKMANSAQYHYLVGLVADLRNTGVKAVESYLKARSLDANHTNATFRLAYFYDLHGEEDQAIELYRQCMAHPPLYANVLLNLAVLYEDRGDNDKCLSCLRSVLDNMPNHPRALLFLKDANASKTMFYDEDQAKRVARRNAVLDIPVTDFELSVRARNCLKKMNIRSLGDLVRTTEAELLNYKNFGETSLKEIKDMLTAKGLRLGQAMEDGDEVVQAAPEVVVAAPKVTNTGMLATPIEHVEFSIRARRALQSLNIKTVGDLAAKTEADLLGCKNFGQTSLNEIRQRLAEYGLQLKTA